MRAVISGVVAAVAAGVLFAASPDGSSAASVDTRPLRVLAELQHVPPTGPPYFTRVSGVLDLNFASFADGTATARAVVRPGSCFTTVGWVVAAMPPGLTAPAEVCLADDAASESAFDAWMAGQKVADPSLTIGLVGAGTPPTSWSNPAPVAAQLFLRGCGAGAFRRLAALQIAPGGLSVHASVDAGGESQLDVMATGAVLHDFSLAAWGEVLAGCGGAAAGLPAMPDAGMSTQVAATTSTPPGDPSLPHVKIAQLHDAVDDLVEIQALPAGKGRSLARKLDKSIKRLRRAQAGKALQQLDRFQTLTTVFEQRGFLSMSDGAMLRDQATGAGAAIEMITVGGTVGPPDPDLFCEPAPAACPDPIVLYTTYHVRAGAGIGFLPDGSAARPYRTIVDALAAAQANALSGVELRVAGGHYVGDLVITRNTHIIGEARGRPFIEGSITSDGAYRLVVQDVRVSPGDGVGISVDDPCASTRVDNVSIEDASAYGILQRGGAIEIADTLVDGTRSEPDNLTRGTAIYLTCGVGARLDDVTLTANASAGLVVVGQGSTADGAELSVFDTGVHPLLAADLCAAPAIFGAVQVRLGARADFDLFSIRDSDAVALMVSGVDADGEPSRATFRDGTVARTGELAGECSGGLNLMVIDEGALTLEDFDCTQADLAGLLLARGGEADLADGSVSSNLIGVSVQTVGFDLGRLQSRVRYVDNLRNLDAAVLPVPGAAGDLGP